MRRGKKQLKGVDKEILLSRIPTNAAISSLGRSVLRLTRVCSDYFLRASLAGWRMFEIRVAS
jgi:hypothetical protein